MNKSKRIIDKSTKEKGKVVDINIKGNDCEGGNAMPALLENYTNKTNHFDLKQKDDFMEGLKETGIKLKKTFNFDKESLSQAIKDYRKE